MKRLSAISLSLVLVLVLAQAAVGLESPRIVHRDLAARTQAWPDGATVLNDVAVGVAPDGVGATGAVIPGGNVLSYVTEAGEVVLERDGDAASRSVLMTSTPGHISTVVLTLRHVVVLSGEPDPGAPGFVLEPRIFAFDPNTGERSIAATIMPDMEPDVVSYSVGHLSGDANDDAIAFIVNRHEQPGMQSSATSRSTWTFDTTMFYSGLADFNPHEIGVGVPVRGISLDRGRIAFNAGGHVGVALASRVATEYSFSWGLTQTGSLREGLASGRAVGAPSLHNDTLAFVEADESGETGSVIVVDLNSAQVSVVGQGKAVLDSPGPALTDDSVYWVRDAGESTFAPVGGTRRTFVLPHVLEKSGIRATNRGTSTVATLPPDPGALSVIRERQTGQATGQRSAVGAFTGQQDGTYRRVHAIHRGEPLPSFTNARILPTVNKRGVTISVGLPPGGSLPLPLSVESTKSSSPRGGVGKVNLVDFHFRTTVEPTTGPAGPIYSATFEEVGERTFFRFAYPGDGTFGSGESVLFEFAPTPAVTMSLRPASPRRGVSFMIVGEVNTPRPLDRTVTGTATVEVQRLVGRTWREVLRRNPLYESGGTEGSNPVFEARALRLTRPGVYRVGVSVPANEFHEAARTAWRVFRVR